MKNKVLMLLAGLLFTTFSVTNAQNRNHSGDHRGKQSYQYDQMDYGKYRHENRGYKQHRKKHYKRHHGRFNHHPPVVYRAPNFCSPPRAYMGRPAMNINIRL
jgi:hypothetical protein